MAPGGSKRKANQGQQATKKTNKHTRASNLQSTFSVSNLLKTLTPSRLSGGPDQAQSKTLVSSESQKSGQRDGSAISLATTSAGCGPAHIPVQIPSMSLCTLMH